MRMGKQVDSTVKTCNYHLNKISRMRRYISQNAYKTLIQALVTSRLDHGNALLIGASDKSISKLQRVQTRAAITITKTGKREHIRLILKQLHWLPVSSRILYEIMLQTYKALNGLLPSYVRELLPTFAPPEASDQPPSHSWLFPKASRPPTANVDLN